MIFTTRTWNENQACKSTRVPPFSQAQRSHSPWYYWSALLYETTRVALHDEVALTLSFPAVAQSWCSDFYGVACGKPVVKWSFLFSGHKLVRNWESYMISQWCHAMWMARALTSPWQLDWGERVLFMRSTARLPCLEEVFSPSKEKEKNLCIVCSMKTLDE